MGTNCGQHKCKGQHNCGSCNEQKQGRWIVDYLKEYIFECSVCGKTTNITVVDYQYCPYCGAKMQLGSKKNETQG